MTTTTSWKKGVSSLFDTAANWSNGVPTAGDTALITVAGTYTVTSAQANSVGTLNVAKSATLAVTAQAFTWTAGTGKGIMAGTIEASGTGYFELGNAASSSTFNDTGTIKLDDTTIPDSIYILGPTTLAGSGKIEFLGNGAFLYANAPGITLTNDETISGFAGISDSNMNFVNGTRGVVNANADGGYLKFSPGSATNSGLLEATAATGGLEILGSLTQTPTGKVKAAVAGTTLSLGGATITGGAISTVKGALLDTFSGHGTSTINTKTALVNAGTVEAGDGSLGANLVIEGPVTNTGALVAADGNSLFADGNVTGSGTAEISGASAIDFKAMSSAKVTFDPGSTGLLVLGDATKFTGTVAGMAAAPGAAIDLENILFADHPTVAFSKGLLTVTDPITKTTDKIKISGTAGTFTPHAATDGNTLISDPPSLPSANTPLIANYVAASFVGAGRGAGGGMAVAGSHETSDQLPLAAYHG